MKSFLFILPWPLNIPGGVNQVVENLYAQMKSDRKYNPIILINSWNDVKLRLENNDGIDCYYLRMRSPWSSTKKIYNFALFMIEAFRTNLMLYLFINKNKITTINLHYCSLYALNIVLLKYLKMYKGRIILSFHGKDLLEAIPSRGIERFFCNFVLKHIDTAVTCSEFLKNDLIAFVNSCHSKAVAIHNGINPASFNGTVDRYLDVDLKDKKYILNVATFEHKKGQDVLLKAFAEISDASPDVSLVIIGRPGGVEHQIKHSIDFLNLSHRVHLYEGLSHDHVLAIMERAMIFVLPSRYEPFGIVILEAGAFGVPVIASEVGGIKEILIHNETGLMFKSEDFNCLAGHIGYLLENQDERKRLGGNLKKHINEKFAWGKTYKSYLEISG